MSATEWRSEAPEEMPLREAQLDAAAEAMAGARLVILRGLPGSGKTTFARRLVEWRGFRLFEADQHFETTEGYRYDPARVADAHAATLRAALDALERGHAVVLANTHVRRWELAGPLGLATLVGVTAHVVECTGRWANVHGVDEATCRAMARRWETMPTRARVRLWRWDGSALVGPMTDDETRAG